MRFYGKSVLLLLFDIAGPFTPQQVNAGARQLKSAGRLLVVAESIGAIFFATLVKYGVPGQVRTANLPLRRGMLYPIELLRQGRKRHGGHGAKDGVHVNGHA